MDKRLTAHTVVIGIDGIPTIVNPGIDMICIDCEGTTGYRMNLRSNRADSIEKGDKENEIL